MDITDAQVGRILSRENFTSQESEARTVLQVTDPVSVYALNRLLTARRLWDHHAWKDGKFLGRDGLRDDLQKFSQLDPHDQVRLSLQAEYGRVLPELQHAWFVIVERSPQSLVRPQGTHRPAGHRAYDPDLPVALVAGYSGLRVLDGYHRVASALQGGRAKVRVLHAR